VTSLETRGLTIRFGGHVAVDDVSCAFRPGELTAIVGPNGAGKISKLGLPVVIPVAEWRDLVGAAVTETLSGADPAAELKKAHDQFRPILERSEKAS